MKRYTMFVFLIVLSGQFSCGQQRDKNNKSLPVAITKEQYNQISKSIKTYAYNPTYQVRFTAGSCAYEIYVNDMLVTFSFTTGNTAGEQHADIPQYLLKSGVQELKVNIYPKASKDGVLETKLAKDAVFTARIVHGEYGKTNHDEFREVAKFSVPVLSQDLSEYTLQGSFNTEIPYSLKGWATGQDLTKDNKDGLKKEVLAIYSLFNQAFMDKDIPAIVSMIYKREQEVAQAFFFKSGERGNYDQGWEKLETEAKDLTTIKIAKDSELRFFADGKVVALLQSKGENRDFSAIEGETEKKYVYYVLYLYRPAAGAPLEVIR